MTTGKPQALRLYLIRHGETAWSLSGQYTGRTDIPLSSHGEEAARALGQQLRDIPFSHVLTSPLLRARQTCELAGLVPGAKSNRISRNGLPVEQAQHFLLSTASLSILAYEHNLPEVSAIVLWNAFTNESRQLDAFTNCELDETPCNHLNLGIRTPSPLDRQELSRAVPPAPRSESVPHFTATPASGSRSATASLTRSFSHTSIRPLHATCSF